MDPSNNRMAGIAAIGAVGDKLFVDGKLVSINRDTIIEGVNQGFLEIKEDTANERYILKSPKGDIRLDELGDYLDILGVAGYYTNGPALGVKVCLHGITPASDQMVNLLKESTKRAFGREFGRFKKEGFNISPHIQWFNLKNRFSNTGVKMVGLLCEEIINAGLIDQKKYVAGFQIIPNKIPGMGFIEVNQTKISMRVANYMAVQIRAGNEMGLDVLLPEATIRLGGFTDACHSLTAATTVSIGYEERLIGEMERILSSYNNKT